MIILILYLPVNQIQFMYLVMTCLLSKVVLLSASFPFISHYFVFNKVTFQIKIRPGVKRKETLYEWRMIIY